MITINFNSKRYHLKYKISLLCLKKNTFTTSEDSTFTTSEDSPYLQICTTGGLVPRKTVLAMCDNMHTGAQFVKHVRTISYDKILAEVIALNSESKYEPTRQLGQFVVVRVRNGTLRVLEKILKDLPVNEISNLDTERYGVLCKKPTEEEQNRIEQSVLIVNETIMTVIDDSGAKYVRYIDAYKSKEETIEKDCIIVQVLTMNYNLDHTKRRFPNMDRKQYYLAKKSTRTKTFNYTDSEKTFTRTEFCAELIRRVER